MLKREPEGSFIVRASNSKNGLALSVRVPQDFHPEGIVHYLIIRSPKGFKIKVRIKVLSLLEACLDLILSPLLSMKIQIVGGKITENLGFKSPLQKVKMFLFFFLFIFKFFTQKWISFILTAF